MRSALHAAGLRFRTHYRPVPGLRTVVDVAFTRWRVAVQLDGCFRHGCPEHGTLPTAHADYWVEKLGHNIERDRRSDRDLAEAGWLVLRFWEHERPEDIVRAVEHALVARRLATRHEEGHPSP